MSPECSAVFARLSEFLDDELSEEYCVRLRAHIGGCESCEEFVNSLRRSVALSREVPLAAPDALSPECREALRRAYLDREVKP